MAGLTFVNQVGAVEGMNQAAPGTLIPDSFVRWSQDVLFDRAGLMRRRGPFESFTLYTSGGVEEPDSRFGSGATNEYVVAVVSAYDPTGTPRIGMVVNGYVGTVATTYFRVFDNQFRFLGQEIIPTITNLSIVTAKPALGGGVWVSFAGDPSDASTHYQFFWRGGYGSVNGAIVSKTGTFEVNEVGASSNKLDSEHALISKTITLSTNTSNVAEGQFVFVTHTDGKDYYIGTVKDVDAISKKITLEKRPFIWDSTITNNHGVFAINPIANVAWASNVCTITTTNAMLYEIGDAVKITVTSGGTGVLNNNTYTITSINATAKTFSFALTSNPGNPSGSVDMNYSLDKIGLSGLSLKFLSMRPYHHEHGRGLITINNEDGSLIISGEAGTSGEGHWQSANVVDWNLYRSSDNAYLGKVKTITNNTTGDLYADPGVKITGEEYIMCPVRSFNISTGSANDYRVSNRVYGSFGGLYSAVYAGYQWYGNIANEDENVNRVVFSAPHDREAVDLSADSADSIVFPGKSQFRGMAGSSAGLLVFLEDRVYILRGNDRTNFSVEQLVPEGCLCPSSIVEYGGGVFWAGKSGIMYFDGASVRNLTKDNLGLYYTDSLDTFDPFSDRVIGFIHKNNLMMHYTSWKSPFDPIRYEPIYAADWQNTDGIKDRGWDEFDPDFEYDDFFTQNNTPIFWDRKILNNPEESGTTSLGFTWPTRWSVTTKSLTSNVATLTIGTHTLVVGNSVWVEGVDSTFNGRYTITAVTSTTISYAKTASNVSSTAATGHVNFGGVAWQASTSIYKWGPLRKNTSITFNIYLPTNAITTFSNIDYRGATSIETVNGLKTILGVNSVESGGMRVRFIDIHPVFDTNTNGSDDLLVEKINIPNSELVLGPDFYLQTKHFTVGDPILRKWFQRIMISMLLYDGAIRMDLVDDDDNDAVDINKKKHKYWEVFTEKGYDWDYLTDTQFPKVTSPNKSNWKNVDDALYLWDELFTSDFNRYAKRLSWRYPSIGFRLYQLNDYKKPFNGVVTVPNRVEIQGFSIGFKALRQGRV